MKGSEIEDIFPAKFLARMISKFLRKHSDENFSDIENMAQPVIPQVEAFAKMHHITLNPGWKVELARLVKKEILISPDSISSDKEIISKWVKLFKTLLK